MPAKGLFRHWLLAEIHSHHVFVLFILHCWEYPDISDDEIVRRDELIINNEARLAWGRSRLESACYNKYGGQEFNEIHERCRKFKWSGS